MGKNKNSDSSKIKKAVSQKILWDKHGGPGKEQPFTFGPHFSCQFRRSSRRILFSFSRYKFAQKMIGSNKSILELGCSDGTGMVFLSQEAKKVSGVDFDAEAIMEFVETHCKVSVSYTQPGGKLAKATGFDFAKAQNIGRGGIISCEWTAQVVVAYQVLSHYFDIAGDKEKSAFYQDQVHYYLAELQKLIITSPSKIGKGRGCLPYASQDNADTGHGWRTPKGIRTGSVSSTAYGIFAWVAFNPFDLDNQINIERSSRDME